MVLRKWDALPDFMKCEEVKEYYNILEKRRNANGDRHLRCSCQLF